MDRRQDGRCDRQDEREDHELDPGAHDRADGLLCQKLCLRKERPGDEHARDRGDEVVLQDGQKRLDRHHQERGHDQQVADAEDEGIPQIGDADVAQRLG